MLQGKRFKTFFRNVVKYRALLLMLVPMLVFLIINEFLPMFGLVIAFKDVNYRDGIFFSPWVGLENFKFLFATDAAWRITRNTILYNLSFIVFNMLAAVTIAIAFNELKNKVTSKVYQTFMLLPHFLSMVVVSYVAYAFLDPKYGFLNNLLMKFGGNSINWYTETVYWPFILFILKIWHSFGYGSVIYLATIAGIDKEMYEAACIDGATKWQQIKFITIPMLKSVMIILLILNLGHIIKGDFGLFYQVPLNSSLLYPVTDILDTYVYRGLIELNDIGMASAAGFYQSIIGFIMVITANTVVKKIDGEQGLF